MENNMENIYDGANPIPERTWNHGMTRWNCSLGFITSNMKIDFVGGKEVRGFNTDPYVTDVNGERVHFQRELCWTDDDKRSLIESIYHDMNCGVIVLRTNSTERSLEVGADYDVIDGKQRISTLIEFFNNGFADMHGNYWRDLSVVAQRRFRSRQPFMVYEFHEGVSDKDVIEAFLNVNFKGTPMSTEHIEFVKSIRL